MGNKICIDTELLRQISSQLSQVHHSLSGIQQKLSSSVSEVGRVVSDQVGLINVLSSVQKNTQKASEYTDRLAKAVNNAAAKWEEVERQIANQQLQGSEGAPQGTGGGAGTGVQFWRRAVIGSAIGLIGPAIYGPMGLGIVADIGLGIGAEIKAGSVLEETYRINTPSEEFWNNPWKLFPNKPGEYSAEEYEAKYGNFFAKGGWINRSLKTKGQIGWDDAEYEKDKGLDKEKSSIGVSAGVASELNLAQLEYGYRGKYGELTNKNTLLGAAASGDVGLTLFTKDGFDPQAYVKAKAEVYGAKGELSGKLGTEDLNLYGGAEVTALGAGAEGKAGYYRDKNGNKKLGASAEAEAYWVKGEVKGGIDILGVKIGASGEAMAGATASIGAEIGSSSVSGQVGAGPFKVKINVDASDLINKYFTDQKT